VKKFLIVFFGLCILFCGTSPALSQPLDDYVLNFSQAGVLEGAVLPDLLAVDEWQFLARSIVAFNDNDASGGISTGDTFDDFVALRITGMTDVADNDITPLTYGSGPGRDHEMTVLAEFNGVQTSPNTYSVTSFTQFDLFFDAGTFTGSNFADLSTFGDGTLVEQGLLIFGAGVNTDPTNITGTLSLVLELDDIMHTLAGNEYFELDENGDPFDPWEIVFAIVDSNNNLQDFDTAPFTTQFGFNPANYDFFFTANNDGSINKEISIIPEPASMVLLGSGLIGFAGIGRRRFLKKKD
jgi:hypothetical protein